MTMMNPTMQITCDKGIAFKAGAHLGVVAEAIVFTLMTGFAFSTWGSYQGEAQGLKLFEWGPGGSKFEN